MNGPLTAAICVQDISDLAAQKASQQRRKAEQTKQNTAKKQKEFRFLVWHWPSVGLAGCASARCCRLLQLISIVLLSCRVQTPALYQS